MKEIQRKDLLKAVEGLINSIKEADSAKITIEAGMESAINGQTLLEESETNGELTFVCRLYTAKLDKRGDLYNRCHVQAIGGKDERRNFKDL